MAGVLTFQAHLTDLGKPGLLGFTVLASSDGSTVEETAPDSILPNGVSVYEVRVASGETPTLKGTLTVGRAKAGMRLNVTLVYQRSDLAARTGKTFTCKATVAGKALHPVVSKSEGAVVSCGWQLASNSRGRSSTAASVFPSRARPGPI